MSETGNSIGTTHTGGASRPGGASRSGGASRPDGATPSGSAKRANTVRILKWAVFVAAVIFFFSVLREAVDPYGDQAYVEITHGDHVHYVPKDRDQNVPVGRFPTREPGPDERITPEGRIVAK